MLVSVYYHEILGSYIKYLKIMTLTRDIKKKKILPTQSYVLVPDDQTTTTTTNRQTNMFFNPPKKTIINDKMNSSK